jgi:hypothetical protein
VTLDKNGKKTLRDYVVTIRVTRYRKAKARSPEAAAKRAVADLGFWDLNPEVIEVEEVK